MSKNICFTGPRAQKLCGYVYASYAPFIKNLKSYIAQIIDKTDGDIEFISGGAQGFDQIAFWAVNDVQSGKFDGIKRPAVRNVVYEPFVNYGEKWSATGLFSKEEYRNMCELATYKATLSSQPESKFDVVRLLNERNHEMVNRSDMVIALYPDDSWSNPSTRGGTAECMRYAKSKNKTIYQIRYEIENNILYFKSAKKIV